MWSLMISCILDWSIPVTPLNDAKPTGYFRKVTLFFKVIFFWVFFIFIFWIFFRGKDLLRMGFRGLWVGIWKVCYKGFWEVIFLCGCGGYHPTIYLAPFQFRRIPHPLPINI